MNKLKNIFNLSKFYIKENENSIRFLKKDLLKSEKRYSTVFMYIVLLFGILYLSVEVVGYIVKQGKPEIFLNIFFLLLNILIIIKTVMVCLNVFYFSKDIENVLHLPLKPAEILISKFNTILFMNYELELLFAVIPLLVYGSIIGASLYYYLNTIILLIIFPIFATLIVSIIMIFLMKTIKLFKNKELMQMLISIITVIIIILISNYSARHIFSNMGEINDNKEVALNSLNNRIIGINKYFLNINSSVNILNENSFVVVVVNYIKLLFINICAFGLFVLLGNKMYLKQLLKAKFYSKTKRKEIINLNKKCKKKNVCKSYIKKEFKTLIKNPMFFIQSVYPVIMATIVISLLLFVLVPVFRNIMQQEEYIDEFKDFKFDIEAVCLIIGTIQIVGLFNYTSITSFSKEGKNAYIIKTLPISYFKQIIYKSIPQIVINIFSSVLLFVALYYKVPEIGLNYIFILFIISTLLTIINSFILCLIDLIRPKLEWDGEYELLKNNSNKLLQYVLIIFNIMFMILLKEIFEKLDLNFSLVSIIVLLIICLIIMSIIINKNKNKLYKRIN